MRVVGGAWRGRPLVAPAGRGTRPTSDKVREAIFDVLQALPEMGAGTGLAGLDGHAVLAGHAVLDLYAGSGALGIEALSRGAARCTFVERDRAALSALRRNLAALGVETVRRAEAGAHQSAGRAVDAPPAARVVSADVRRALQADARVGVCILSCLRTRPTPDPPTRRTSCRACWDQSSRRRP